MAGFKTSPDDSQPLSEINITPFVDVMLVLLIIFMVAAPLMESGIAVQLPKTASQSLPSRKEEPLIVSIQKNQKIFVGKKEVSPETLSALLKKGLKNSKSDEVLVRADAELPYGVVAKTMATIKGSGFQKIGLITEIESRPKKK